MKDRGKPIEVPTWWLELAVDALASRKDGLVELGRLLADTIGRKTPYNHGMLSKFILHPNRVTTQELADAVSIFFGLPRAYYVPRSKAEAEAIRSIHATFDEIDRIKNDPVRSERISKVDRDLAETLALPEHRPGEDRSHTDPVISRIHEDEGRTSRGTGSVSRRRRAPAGD